MRFVMVLLSVMVAGLLTTNASAETCRYVFKAGQGLVDSCTGEKPSNSSPRGVGPAIEQKPVCHPSYSACLKPDAVDYDCEGGTGNGPLFVKGPLQVLGDDVFGLDRNGNLTACEADE